MAQINQFIIESTSLILSEARLLSNTERTEALLEGSKARIVAILRNVNRVIPEGGQPCLDIARVCEDILAGIEDHKR